MENKITILDDMMPLKDYLQGKTSTVDFIKSCREISETENAEFEIIEQLQLSENINQ